MKIRDIRKIQMLIVVLLVASGCGHTITVRPTPADSIVKLDNGQVGKGVTDVHLNDKERNYVLEVCGPPGYFCTSRIVNFNTQRNIEMTPERDNSYWETKESTDIVNKWIALPVAHQYDAEEAWRKLTSSLTGAIEDFEVIDQKSLYLKTAWKMAGLKSDDRRIRSRMLVSVDNADLANLSFKLKIESEYIDHKGERLENVGRTFQSFLEALETGRSRLAR